MDIKTFWASCKEKTGIKKEYVEAYYFCDNENDAKELADLVVKGIKKATASNYVCYENGDYILPKVGDLNVITDFNDEPVCVVETTEVEIVKFKDVTEEFAAAEGEGDKSLLYWKRAHESFFTRELNDMGKEFTEDILVLCEKFKVVYLHECV